MMRFTALLSFAAVVKSQGACTSDTNGDNTVDGERRGPRSFHFTLRAKDELAPQRGRPALSRSR